MDGCLWCFNILWFYALSSSGPAETSIQVKTASPSRNQSGDRCEKFVEWSIDRVDP
jgi:hypothetical protein